MAEAKTKPSKISPKAFLEKLTDPQQRKESLVILNMMRKITGEKPVMWGPGMIGFGTYHYQYESGHEGDCFITGFSPRKGQLSLYITAGCGEFPELLKKLGKFKTGKSCLYIKKLDDIDLAVLQKIVKEGYALTKKKYPRARKSK